MPYSNYGLHVNAVGDTAASVFSIINQLKFQCIPTVISY